MTMRYRLIASLQLTFDLQTSKTYIEEKKAPDLWTFISIIINRDNVEVRRLNSRYTQAAIGLVSGEQNSLYWASTQSARKWTDHWHARPVLYASDARRAFGIGRASRAFVVAQIPNRLTKDCAQATPVEKSFPVQAKVSGWSMLFSSLL